MSRTVRSRVTSERAFLASTLAVALVAPSALTLPAHAETGAAPSSVLVHYDMSHHGNRLLDTSGRGMDATIRGSLGGFSTRDGDDVLKFDGSTYVELPNFVGENTSVVVELKYSNGSRDNEGLFSLGTTSDNDYLRFHPNASGRYLWETKTQGNYLKSEGPTSSGNDGWTTASAVFRPDSSADLIMNGALDGSVRTGDLISHYAAPNGAGVAGLLGKPVWAGDPLFTGTLTDVLVYTVPAPNAPASTPTKVVSTSFPSRSEGSNWWRSSMITGNGENGALVAGNPVSDTLIYQNISFNMPNRDARATPNIAPALEANRRTLVDGGTVAGNPVAGQGMQWDYAFHPGNQLQLQVPGAGVPTNHYRWTDYRTGEVGVNYTGSDGETWERRTFSSRVDNVVVTHLTRSSSGKPINLNLDITPVDDMAVEGGSLDGNLRYKQIAAPDASYIGQVAHYPSYAGSELASAGYAGVTSIVTKGGSKTLREKAATGPRAVTGSRLYGVDIRDADEVFLITRSDRDKQMGAMSAFGGQTSFPLVDRLVSGISAVAAKPEYRGSNGLDYANLLAPHVAAHGAEFDAVKLELPAAESGRSLSNEELIARQQSAPGSLDNAMVERAFAAGRYATISSSGFSAPRLGGMWTGAWNPAWSGDWTTDANVNLQVAGANIGALPSEMNGLINLILRTAPDWETNAARIYGMRDAVLAPPRTDSDNGAMYHFGDDYPFQYWNAGASWLLLPMYEYWLVHGNVEVPIAADINVAQLRSVLSPTESDLTDAQVAVIRNRGTLRLADDLLLPLLRKQSNFWQQLTDPRYFETAGGEAKFTEGKTTLSPGEHYLLLPCYSPENKPANRQSPVAINCSMDIGAARDGLRMTMDVERALNAVTPGNRWQRLSDDLPPVTYDANNGALKEWSLARFDEQHAHRHVSQAYFAWPAHDTQTSSEMAAGLSKTVDLRKQTAGDKSSGHGWLHMALIDARLKNAGGVDEALRALLGTRSYYSSFTTNHNITGDSSYVTDILATVPAVLLESMVYSNRGTIEILPAIPSSLAAGALSGSLTRSRAQISELSWNLADKTASAVIRSDIDQTINVSSGQKWASVSIDGRTYRNTGAPVPVTFTAGKSSTVVFTLGEPSAPEPPILKTELTVASRCIGGRVTVVSTVKNASAVPVSVEVTTAFGNKTIASLAAGKNASQAFSTRKSQIEAGEVTITTTGQANGTTATATQKVQYGARSCD